MLPKNYQIPKNYHKPKECIAIKVAPGHILEYKYPFYEVSRNIGTDGWWYITLWRD